MIVSYLLLKNKEYIKMMKVLTVFIACLLAGCTTTIEKTITIRTIEYIPVTVSSALLKPYDIPELFTRQEYLSMTDKERRSALVDAVIDRDAVINQCNIRLSYIAKESESIKDTILKNTPEPTKSESIIKYKGGPRK